jgi:hypothetical protein
MNELRSCFIHGDYTGKDQCPGCQPAPRDSLEAVIEKLEARVRALDATPSGNHIAQAARNGMIAGFQEAIALLRETGA